MSKEIVYHVERLKKDWEPQNGPLGLEEAEALFKKMIEVHPSNKWRIMQTKVTEEVYEEYAPKSKKEKTQEETIKRLTLERDEAKMKLEQYTNVLAAHHISIGL